MGTRTARFAWAAVAVILVGAIALVTYALTDPTVTQRTAQRATAAPDVVLRRSWPRCPLAVFDSVGVSAPQTSLVAPTPVSGQPVLKVDGKPEVLYVGAEYCPFCAAERWPLIVALSRFGRFSELKDMQSAQLSVFPGTQTFSFVGSTYTSRYLAFAGVELYGRPSTPRGNSLASPPSARSRLWPSAGTGRDPPGPIRSSTSATGWSRRPRHSVPRSW